MISQTTTKIKYLKNKIISETNNSFVVTSKDTQNTDVSSEKNIVHDIHDLEILMEREDVDTEAMDAEAMYACKTGTMNNSLKLKEYCIIEKLRSWAIECNI